MKDEEADQVNDRGSDYKRMRVYSSFEEQEDAHREYMASLSPAERIREAVILIKKVYHYKGPDPDAPKRITIKKRL